MLLRWGLRARLATPRSPDLSHPSAVHHKGLSTGSPPPPPPPAPFPPPPVTASPAAAGGCPDGGGSSPSRSCQPLHLRCTPPLSCPSPLGFVWSRGVSRRLPPSRGVVGALRREEPLPEGHLHVCPVAHQEPCRPLLVPSPQILQGSGPLGELPGAAQPPSRHPCPGCPPQGRGKCGPVCEYTMLVCRLCQLCALGLVVSFTS